MGAMEILASQSSPRWAAYCTEHLDEVMADHAHCEKKAAAAALSLIHDYPQHTRLVRQMAALACEEMRHFRQVHRLIVAQRRVLTPDRGDPYVKALRQHVRHAQGPRLLDRLLICALIEARSCERLGLLGAALQPPTLSQFYTTLAVREAGHAKLFMQLACHLGDAASARSRLGSLRLIEADLVQRLPLAPRIH